MRVPGLDGVFHDPVAAADADRLSPRKHDTTPARLPVVAVTSVDTARRPMVDDPRHPLEHVGSAPIDALVIGALRMRGRAARAREVAS